MSQKEHRIKISIRRLQAISNVLSYSTSKSYDPLQMHLVWAGDYAMSALIDDLLGSSFISPNSLPPEQALVDQATLIARDAAAHPRFEDEVLHLTDRHQWLALKPKEQQWISARQIIQHWDITMRMCLQIRPEARGIRGT